MLTYLGLLSAAMGNQRMLSFIEYMCLILVAEGSLYILLQKKNSWGQELSLPYLSGRGLWLPSYEVTIFEVHQVEYVCGMFGTIDYSAQMKKKEVKKTSCKLLAWKTGWQGKPSTKPGYRRKSYLISGADYRQEFTLRPFKFEVLVIGLCSRVQGSWDWI